MKTMKGNNQIVRVPELDVERLLRQGYELCSKDEWKKAVRDAPMSLESDSAITVTAKKKKKKK